MVDFYRDSPAYEYQEAKYIVYLLLFPEIDNQETRIDYNLSHGWAMQDAPENLPEPTDSKSDYRMIYSVDGVDIMTIKEVQVTISGKGMRRKTYTRFSNPDNIRIVFEDVCTMGRTQDIVWNEDGTPNIEASPKFYAVKCMFNELPVDNVNYVIEVIGDNDEIIMSETGTINIIDPPWVVGIEL